MIEPITPVLWDPDHNSFLLWKDGPEEVGLHKSAFAKGKDVRYRETAMFTVCFTHRNAQGRLRINLNYPFTLQDEQEMYDWSSQVEGFSPQAQCFLAHCMEARGVALLPVVLALKLADERGEHTLFHPPSRRVRR